MNRIQRLVIILSLATLASIPANAAPPENLSGLVLGASLQEVKDKYGSRLKFSPKYKEDLAASRCGIDRYEIDLPDFDREEIYFYRGKLFNIRMGMKASLTMSEAFALAKRFISKYGNPSSLICANPNEGVIKKYSIDKCEFKPAITLAYENGFEGSPERHEFSVNIFSIDYNDPYFQGLGYNLNLMKGWDYYYDTTEPCRKRALLTIDEENAERITLPE